MQDEWKGIEIPKANHQEKTALKYPISSTMIWCCVRENGPLFLELQEQNCMIDRYWRDRSLRAKLTWLALLPLGALSVLILLGLLQQVLLVQSALDLSKSTRVMVASSTLLHNLQLERGLSIGFLSARSRKLPQELHDARAKVDDAVAMAKKLHITIALQGNAPKSPHGTGQHNPDRSTDERTRATIQHILGPLRSRIDKRIIDIDSTILGYEKLVHANADLIDHIVTHTKSTKATRLGVNYSSMIRATESAGLERAFLAMAFTKDRFEAGGYARLLRTQQEEEHHLESVRRFSSTLIREKLDALQSTKAFVVVERFRNIAARSHDFGNFDIKPRRWFAAATERMNGLNDIANNLCMQIMQTSIQERNTALELLLLRLFLVVAIYGVALWGTRNIALGLTNRLQAILEGLEELSHGKLTRQIVDVGNDEVTRMAEAFNAACAHTRKGVEAILGDSESLQSAATDMTEVSQKLVAISGDTQRMASSAVDASSLICDTVGTVSVGTQEMSLSIEEVAQSATVAARVASEAEHSAQAAHVAISTFETNSTQIDDIVGAISTIARQTNLLALNATIEAARAGEQGKGFAVVANEVKALARLTAESAEEVTKKIKTIQSDSHTASLALRGVSVQVEEISNTSQTIAAAVEEQTATTGEITTTLTEAASGAVQLNKVMQEVAGGSNLTADAAERTKSSAAEITRLSENLNALAARFEI